MFKNIIYKNLIDSIQWLVSPIKIHASCVDIDVEWQPHFDMCFYYECYYYCMKKKGKKCERWVLSFSFLRRYNGNIPNVWISFQQYYITIGIWRLLLLPKQISENLGLPILRSLDLDQSTTLLCCSLYINNVLEIVQVWVKKSHIG